MENKDGKKECTICNSLTQQKTIKKEYESCYTYC